MGLDAETELSMDHSISHDQPPRGADAPGHDPFAKPSLERGILALIGSTILAICGLLAIHVLQAHAERAQVDAAAVVAPPSTREPPTFAPARAAAAVQR